MATVLSLGNVIECTVHGLMQGQAIENTFKYKVAGIAGSPTLEEALDAFAFQWRDVVLPFVSDQYSVDTYEAKRLSALLRVGPPVVETVGRLRYDAEVEIAAPGTDVGGIDTAPFPTMTVASFTRKSAGVSTTVYNDDPFPANLAQLEKTFKSSWGLSGMLEADTDVATPNVWNATATDNIDDFGTEMMTLASVVGPNTLSLTEVIVSTIRNGFARFGAAPTDTQLVFAYQDVVSVTLDPIVSTRRTRKPKRAGV